MIQAPYRPSLALDLMNFRAIHRLSNQGLATWLDVRVEDLPAVGAHPSPDRGSMALGAACAAIGRATGADPDALRQVVLRSDWADLLRVPASGSSSQPSSRSIAAT